MLDQQDGHSEAAADLLTQFVDELRIAMFCIGAGTLDALRDTPHLREAGSLVPSARTFLEASPR